MHGEPAEKHIDRRHTSARTLLIEANSAPLRSMGQQQRMARDMHMPFMFPHSPARGLL